MVGGYLAFTFPSEEIGIIIAYDRGEGSRDALSQILYLSVEEGEAAVLFRQAVLRTVAGKEEEDGTFFIFAVIDGTEIFRWWGAPDTEQFKRFFIKEGVDLVGADDLNGLYNVLNER